MKVILVNKKFNLLHSICFLALTVSVEPVDGHDEVGDQVNGLQKHVEAEKQGQVDELGPQMQNFLLWLSSTFNFSKISWGF